MAIVVGFRSRYTGRCERCRQPYDAGTMVISTTPAHIVPPRFAHHPACPPRPSLGEPVTVDPNPDAHRPAVIGKYDETGARTHGPIGEVCTGCSDPHAGRWVPVSDCPIAYAKWQIEYESHGGASETLT